MTALTPALLDLMEHEKVIEQGIASFVEVGTALLAIRDGKKYRAAGYKTFESYCRERWDFTANYGRRLIRAAELVESVPDGTVSSEGAARRLLAPKRDHPAPFSDPILDTVAEHVRGARVVLDPFAGTGRVHELREAAGVERTIGVEIEEEWADRHPDTIHGDALQLGTLVEPESVDAIATSPTYGNRMADHHDARDDSVRLTYKHTLGRDLADGNSGQLQWGEEYRAFHRAAWSEAVAVLHPGGTFTLNIKNHVRAGEVQRVAEWHINTLMHDLGLRLVALDVVPTAGLMAGENADRRTAHEFVATFRKDTP
jgi:hypothetical protein